MIEAATAGTIDPAAFHGSPLLETSDLHVRFSTGGGLFQKSNVIRAVDGISLAVMAGETLAVVGESGCGKTTLARALAMLQRPTSGRIMFAGETLSDLDGKRLRKARRHIQMIFQDPYASLDPRQNVGAIVAEPMVIVGIDKATRKRRVAELLEMVGLGEDAAARLPRQFSGGQRQRIGIARALAADPKLVICDEPLSALDVSIQAQVVNLLVDVQKRLGLTYVFVSHDLAVVRQMADRVAVMYLGVIVELAATDTLFAEPRHPYTVALMSAVPTLATAEVATAPPQLISGDPPSPIDIPRGCRFHTRCWLRERLGNPPRCVSDEPRLTAGTEGKAACHFAKDTASEARALIKDLMHPRTGKA